MMSYRRMSIFFSSASVTARSSGATRKPMTIACEASARRMSLSLIPPTALQEDPDRDLGVLQLLKLLGEGLERALDVGLEDQVEALDLLLGHLAVEVFERDGLALAQGDARVRMRRVSAISRAREMSSMTANFSPAVGTASRPETSTGIEGPASVTERPLSSNRARTRP